MQDLLFSPLFELLPAYGPGLLLALTFLETSFLTGFLVPAGLATAAATVLALEGRLDMASVATVALIGGAVGDNVGFWVGRAWGTHLLAGTGRWSRAMARHQASASDLLGRHPIYSVSVARLISMVRTVMPMAAGMSGMSYRRYVPYQAVGLVGCVTIYMGIGLVAQESWEVVTQVIGVGGTVVFAIAGFFLWRAWRRRRKGRSPRATA